MADLTFVNCKVLVNGVFVSGKRLMVKGEWIAAVEDDQGPITGQPINCRGRLLFPGFIDTQINGGGGVLFNADPSVEALRNMSVAFQPSGTTAMLPTFVSDRVERIPIAIAAVRDAINQRVPGIIGIHLEGPFLSETRKGAHDADVFGDLGAELVDMLAGLDNGTTLITLAPERTTSTVIAELVRRGVIVAVGHSDANSETVKSAAAAGVTGFTHLFNAMAPFTARNPGCVGAALTFEDCWCGIIADGHHVSDEALQIAWRCKGRDRLMLVTDAISMVGMPEGSVFRFGNSEVMLKDGACRNQDGVLSGSAITMRTAVLNAMKRMKIELADAIAMATETPARFLRIDGERGRIAPGLRADFILADAKLEAMEVWIGGERA